jgi:hypothetical protein
MTDKELFDSRPKRVQTCWHCHGSGSVVDSYALVHHDAFIEGAPPNAILALVMGSFDIHTACREAAAIAHQARRPVAFEFSGKTVVVNVADDGDAVARRWWLNEYGETPEASRARR